MITSTLHSEKLLHEGDEVKEVEQVKEVKEVKRVKLIKLVHQVIPVEWAMQATCIQGAEQWNKNKAGAHGGALDNISFCLLAAPPPPLFSQV